jgi:hypothetical protein
VLSTVLNSINFDKTEFKTTLLELIKFFTAEPIIFPQQQFFKYNIGQKVFLDYKPSTRRDLQYKYSLAFGKKITNPSFILISI